MDDEEFFNGASGVVIMGNPALGHANQVVKKLNEKEEEDLIRDLENQGKENDTLKELEEALLDRNTAQKTLRNKSQFLTQHTKINSSNFLKSNQEPSQVIKKLKLMSQKTSQPATPGFPNTNASAKKLPE